ncbi:MAG: hypothetical protein WC002_04780 [Candidatus Muiribacteriota bacterium]
MKSKLSFLYSILAKTERRNFAGEFFYGFILVILFSVSLSLNNRIIKMLATDMEPTEYYYVFGHFLALFLFILFTIASLSLIIQLFTILFYDTELPFLFSLPLSKRSVFLNRFVRAYIYGSIMFLIFSAGALSSITKNFELGAWYFITSFISAGFVAVTYTSIGFIIILLSLKMFGSVNTRKFLSGFTIFLLSSLIVLFRFIRPERFFRTGDADLIEYLESFKNPIFSIFPTEFIKNIFYSFMESNTTGIIIAFTLNIAVSLIFFFIALYMFKKIYKPYHHIRKENHNSNIEFKINAEKSAENLLKTKEKVLFYRNNVNFQQLWLFAGLIMVFLFNVYFLKDLETKMVTSILYLNKAVILLITASFFARVFFDLFSNNHEEIEFLKSLPIKTESIYKARIHLFFPPLLLFGGLMALFMLVLYRVNLILTLLTIYNIFFFTYFMMMSAIFFSNYFKKRKVTVFSLPVQLYIVLNMILGLILLSSQAGYYTGWSRGRVSAENFISIMIAQTVILYLGGMFFYKKSLKNQP